MPHRRKKEASGLVKLTGEVGQKQIGCFSNFCIGLNFKLGTKVMHVFVDVGKFIT